MPLVCRDLADIDQILQESLADQDERPWLRVSIMLEETIYIDEAVVIHVRLTEAGRPLLDADVQADMHAPYGGCVAVLLLDEGSGAGESPADGEYTALFPAPEIPGTYRFLVTIHGVDEAGTPFSRAHLLTRHAVIRSEDNDLYP